MLCTQEDEVAKDSGSGFDAEEGIREKEVGKLGSCAPHMEN